MNVGDVRIAEDADFSKLKNYCNCHDSWDKEYSKNSTTVWTCVNDVTSFKMIKVHSHFKDVSASTVYDVLHDPEFRKTWDNNMLESYDLCCLNPNNDIGYYALKAPKPLKNRDFVIQRSWLDTGKEYFIVNHSVNHQDIPPKKNFVRAISYYTGYWIVPADKNQNSPGCDIHYVTQSDPKGKLPAWIVNKMTNFTVPKIMNRIHKACRKYESWKNKNNPNWKPWLFPEQMTLPRLKISDIQSIEEYCNAESIDETDVKEEDVSEIDQKEEDLED